MQFRVDFVERHWQGSVVDVGIGSGAFIEARNAFAKAIPTNLPSRKTFGFDVNPAGKKWLKDRDLFAHVHSEPYVAAVTLWDVLEHIPDFGPLLLNVKLWAFVSIPIFEGPYHALSSKHFRPDEHCWYFTREGLTRMFDRFGFDQVEHSCEESAIGRHEIESFAFRRRG